MFEPSVEIPSLTPIARLGFCLRYFKWTNVVPYASQRHQQHRGHFHGVQPQHPVWRFFDAGARTADGAFVITNPNLIV